uniref:Uncharacterized protein n=1 Tax=Ochrobactrum phage ORM_20 TaxID=2985243 RepID=A0A9N6WTY5_9VIRU|nr:hypothetical protein ORM20_00091 [Ochrobactrum phage ORM_20]
MSLLTLPEVVSSSSEIEEEKKLNKSFPIVIMLTGNRRDIVIYEHGPLTAEARVNTILRDGLKFEDPRHDQIRFFPPSSIEEIYYGK